MSALPKRRLIACLDLRGGKVVKGVAFEGLQEAGAPLGLASRYHEQGADELAILDIAGSATEREGLLSLLRELAGLGLPLLVGGGVASLADAEALLNAGASRVCINSALVREPSLLPALASQLGPERLVASIDARWEEAAGAYRVYIGGGKVATEHEAGAWARRCAEMGAGEILLTSIDRDGGREGFELQLIEAVAAATQLPLIASGGCGGPEHVAQAFAAGAAAVLAAGVLHDGSHTITSLRGER